MLTGMTDSKALATILCFTDLAPGLSLTYFYGEGYFLLAFALPVLTLCGTYGLTAALAMGVFGLIFYGLVYALPLMETASPFSKPISIYSGVSGASSGLTVR